MTSLMDVLTIILIFLLVNYSESIQEADIPDFITLPTIQTNPATEFAEDIKLVIGKHRVSVNGHLIKFRSFEREGERVLAKTVRILQDIKQKRNKSAKKDRISIMADEKIPFEVIDQFLVSAGSVGITKVDFVAYTKGN